MTITEFYQYLFVRYGEQHWWPCVSGSRWEIAAGAVLTQNCAWRNVEKALVNLEAVGLNTPEAVVAADAALIGELVRPAGFFRQKSAYLREVAEFFLANESRFAAAEYTPELRRELLAVKGVGRETADAILLYAFNFPVFVIDAYTRRVAARHLDLDGTEAYDELQRKFAAALPADPALFNEYHALIVCFCKESCRKSGCGGDCPTS
ncbi:MAG: endonuclease III domain-containing protein [Victivallaceae bacterium]|nr:hypothetical protein [Victivallaceae bacterium]